jgi:hypothetical protein
MWYILDNNNKPVPKPVLEAAKWMEKNPEKRIVKQEYIGDIHVSTVFLGLDHGWKSSVPILWETMIFGGEHDQYQERYTSYEDAVEGHKVAVQVAINSLKTKENDNIEERNPESD